MLKTKIKRYSIAGFLPVNVLVEATTKKEAINIAHQLTKLEYESAGDIEINDKFIQELGR
jgi:hypothetical protein